MVAVVDWLPANIYRTKELPIVEHENAVISKLVTWRQGPRDEGRVSNRVATKNMFLVFFLKLYVCLI